MVIDSSGLSAVASKSKRAQGALEISAHTGADVVVPAVVIAESTRGDAAHARVNRVLSGLTVMPVDEGAAREAARLKRVAGMSGVEHTIDALVVAVASLAGGGAILTSDLDDISALATARFDLTIVPIRA